PPPDDEVDGFLAVVADRQLALHDAAAIALTADVDHRTVLGPFLGRFLVLDAAGPKAQRLVDAECRFLAGGYPEARPLPVEPAVGDHDGRPGRHGEGQRVLEAEGVPGRVV